MSSLGANIFQKYKNYLNSNSLDKEEVTQENYKSELFKKKENQIAEHRKKIMKNIYSKIFSRFQNNQNANNISNPNNNMEIEEECNNNNNINDEKNKITLIQEYLNKEKNLYNELGEEFIYQIIDDRKISFCPTCGYPVIIIDKNLSNKGNKTNPDNISIACVNSCFQFEISENVFNKYSMDNIMDLYVQAIKSDNDCHHNDIAPISSGDDGVIFACITCLFEQFK